MSNPVSNHKIFSIKAGDRLPVLEVHLLNCDGNALDLTTYPDVFLVMSHCVGGRRVIDMAPMTVKTPATAGIVTYNWAVGDTDTPGEYSIEVVVSPNFNILPQTDQKLMTLPGGGYGKVLITPRL